MFNWDKTTLFRIGGLVRQLHNQLLNKFTAICLMPMIIYLFKMHNVFLKIILKITGIKTF